MPLAMPGQAICPKCKKRAVYYADLGLCDRCALCRNCMGRTVSAADSMFCEFCACHVCRGKVATDKQLLRDYDGGVDDYGRYKNICHECAKKKDPERFCVDCGNYDADVIVRVPSAPRTDKPSRC